MELECKWHSKAKVMVLFLLLCILKPIRITKNRGMNSLKKMILSEHLHLTKTQKMFSLPFFGLFPVTVKTHEPLKLPVQFHSETLSV
jgi:hypothetical protein